MATSLIKKCTFSIDVHSIRLWREFLKRPVMLMNSGESLREGYGIVEKYKSDDAETVLLTMGSISGTAKVADNMRKSGLSVVC